MSDSDEMKGRAKEAVGDLTDDKDMQREGKLDKAAGSVKKGADAVRDKAEELVDGARKKASDDS